jgi:hypothetical protein
MLVSFICVHLSIQFMKSKFKQKQDLISLNLNIFLCVAAILTLYATINQCDIHIFTRIDIILILPARRYLVVHLLI